MATEPRPTIGITIGDPAGIGPEVVIRALSDPAIRRLGRFVIYGLNEILTYEADRQEVEPFWHRVQHDTERAGRAITEPVVVLDFDEFDGLLRAQRQPSRAGGLASKAFVEEAIADAMRPAEGPRHIDAIVTGPVSKTSWSMAGFRWPGHTELLAHRTKARRHVMMFESPRLRVALATTHLALMDLRNVLTIGRVFDPIDLGHQACLDLGIERPRIAVTGLNPHAGENGRFGDEEMRIIKPAIDVAAGAGMNVTGPLPADTLFAAAAGGRYDLVVAMYHDQGLIPVKLLGCGESVNWTLGLPIVRTSPDHGTAFDIAGTGRAEAGSMTAAIRLAARLARQRMAAASGPESRSEPAA
ncbi:MAG: 4-hydroxythreonine-4-phosphate dehydrogenase PdxA [Planctomycetes bacterium]|nr:4-hydroxythreonine-4-phosphate dehydrogenase PdxA [Planctomycetota bacterium]